MCWRSGMALTSFLPRVPAAYCGHHNGEPWRHTSRVDYDVNIAYACHAPCTVHALPSSAAVPGDGGSAAAVHAAWHVLQHAYHGEHHDVWLPSLPHVPVTCVCVYALAHCLAHRMPRRRASTFHHAPTGDTRGKSCPTHTPCSAPDRMPRVYVGVDQAQPVAATSTLTRVCPSLWARGTTGVADDVLPHAVQAQGRAAEPYAAVDDNGGRRQYRSHHDPT